MSVGNHDEDRLFFRWIRKKYPDWEDDFKKAVSKFSAVLEPDGFRWLDVDFRGYQNGPDELWFERTISKDEVDYICIALDRDSRLSFSVYAARRENSSEYSKFIRTCDLVRRRSDSYYGSKLYGARWWYPIKMPIFRRAVRQVTERLPQIVEFLDTGKAGKNVWVNAPG